MIAVKISLQRKLIEVDHLLGMQQVPDSAYGFSTKLSQLEGDVKGYSPKPQRIAACQNGLR